MLECRLVLSASPLDPSFGANGMVTIPGTLANPALRPPGLTVLPNGNTLAAYTNVITDPNFFHRTYYSAGIAELDMSGRLIATVPFAPSNIDFFTECTGIAQLANGNVMAYGTEDIYDPPSAYYAQEYRANLTSVGDLVQGTDAQVLAVQPNGKMILARYGIGDYSITRLNVDGSVDKSFNAGKPVAVDYSPTAGAVQPDGKILIVGFGTTLLRLNANGSHDRTFRGGGIDQAATDIGTVQSIALEPNGTILLAGDTGTQYEIAAFRPDGHFDSSYASNGLTVLPDTIDDSTLAVGGGRIILTATVEGASPGAANYVAVYRFKLNGTADPGFNDGQPVTLPLPSGHAAGVRDPNGRITVEVGTIIKRILQTPPVG